MGGTTPLPPNKHSHPRPNNADRMNEPLEKRAKSGKTKKFKMNFGKNCLNTVKRQECRTLDWFRSYIFASVCRVLILLCLNFLGSHWLIITLPLPTFWISETLHTLFFLTNLHPRLLRMKCHFFLILCPGCQIQRKADTHTHVSDVESEECMKKRMSMWLDGNLLQALSYTASSKGVLSVWLTYGNAAGFIFKILRGVTSTSVV